MHFSVSALVVIALSSSVLATPIWGKGWGGSEDSKYKDIKKYGGHSEQKYNSMFYFDKTYTVKAYPDQVVSGNGSAATPAPGEHGAKGLFKFGINVAENVICYNITLSGVTGEYSSQANTATHIHEAVEGANGPPRLAFPNPQGPDNRRVSYGCLTGPFETGIVQNGEDTGAGFHVEQIVENPSGFFSDSHTAKFVPGVVRGQLA
ncbi:unnamed protein product [Periconia digitata]|uniref:CHRD domain-containing protein n=1 Tax=Periconia digitata TaxID=1303443 RepID=A0A9W4U3R8_9PLEO|nr:unnamed protein product [Periconia digitata]